MAKLLLMLMLMLMLILMLMYSGSGEVKMLKQTILLCFWCLRALLDLVVITVNFKC
jgi:hypothetical protein